MTKAIFNAKYYAEAGMFTDSETGSRYGINCIRVEPHPVKGALVIATEGHVLGIWHDEYGECSSPVCIRYEPEASAACGVVDNEWEQPQSRIMRVNDDDSITVLNSVGKDIRDQVATFYGLVFPADFPDWRSILPTEETPRMDINPGYVELFGKLNQEKHHIARLALWISPFNGVVSHGTPTPPAVIKVDGREDFTGVVMGQVPQSVDYPSEFFSLLKAQSSGPHATTEAELVDP